MKANLYTLILSLLCFTAVSAQTNINDIRSEVIDVELLKNWKTGQTKVIKEQSITKLKDTGDGTTRTNIMFSLPSHNLFTLPASMVMPIAVPKSGTIYIMVDRATEAEVNANNFSVQLYDVTGTVNFFTALPENAPGKEYKYGIWFNQFGIEIPASVGNEFNIVILDHVTGDKVTYHVESNANVASKKEFSK